MTTPADDLATLRACLIRLRYLATQYVGSRQQRLMENAVELAQDGEDAALRLAAALPDDYAGCMVAGAEEVTG